MTERRVLIEVVLEGEESDFSQCSDWSDRIAQSVYPAICNKVYFETEIKPPVGRQKKPREVIVGGWISVKGVNSVTESQQECVEKVEDDRQ